MNKKEFVYYCKNTKALLIGDVMLDRYVLGKVNRVSPEAPVPVFLANEKKQVLGGAGNVFNNLISMNVFTTFITIVGNDINGKQIKNKLKGIKNCKIYLLNEAKKISTTKTRYLVNGQQLIRVDEEDKLELSKKNYDAILKNFKKELKKHDIVILSDYNKGIFNKNLLAEIIKISNKNKIPVVIDPKQKNFNLYRGADLITPNQIEASKVSNLICNTDKRTEISGKNIIKKYGIKEVLITRGEEGLSFINKKKSLHSKTKKIEVFDVSGAGDTVLSIISICRANKIDIKESLQLANKAAGIVVGKIGTSTISQRELFFEIETKNKIVKKKQLSEIISHYKSKNYKVGFTNGCFDILHYGHIKYLEETKKLCDKLIIAINSDKSVKKIKGTNRPINSEMVRAKILASLIICDHVVIFNEDTPIKIIRTLKPDLLTKGSDYKKSEIVGAKDVKSWNGRIETIKLLKKFSTTNIINGLK